MQGRLLLLLTLFLRVKLFLRTDWLLFSALLVVVLLPDTQLVNCFRGAPSDMKESISRVLLVSVVNRVKFSQGLSQKLGVLSVSVTSSRQSAEYRLCQVSIHCDASTPSACVSVYTSALLQSALMGIWLMISGPQTGLDDEVSMHLLQQIFEFPSSWL